MKLCSRHSGDLINELKKKNLWKFVDTTPHVVKERVQKWLNGHSAPSEIDPLIISVLEINKKAMEFCGSKIAFDKANSQPHCPLCEVGKVVGNKADTEWLDNVTDAVLSLCLQNEMMSTRH